MFDLNFTDMTGNLFEAVSYWWTVMFTDKISIFIGLIVGALIVSLLLRLLLKPNK